MKQVLVAVGIILRHNQTFVTLRADDKHQGGKWEFPGGKVENDETVLAALRRELYEEVGIAVIQTQPLMTIEHDYGDKRVCLEVQVVTGFEGEPYGREQQQGRWVSVDLLDPQEFPAANQAIIEALQKHYRRDDVGLNP
ncbi:8-oxo-dGTP diphosphatase MutT [Salinimonas marina]|uniref:8-oxo-dGTP diphosphatase n=1 Tax=Salinimonas marina TaxID=2785918 RepID=A0A7S9DYG2_9ALTE|nr:8-oxo-dGTP diphosphatase MutT [Salinimonas marina]QPG06296.1 8-oxo-dGTP diphosphatase MutT [Salinimonas marina]